MLKDKITMDNIINAFTGIPVIESDFVAEDTAILINKKTGVGKIIEYETRIQQLKKENAELKKQLSGIKYLDKDEVEEILQRIDMSFHLGNGMGVAEKIPQRIISHIVEQMCNLAIPKLNKDRIIEAIKKYVTFTVSEPLPKGCIDIYEEIANKILGKPDSVTVTEDDGEY